MGNEEIDKYKTALIKAANQIKKLDSEIKQIKESSEIAIIGYHCRFPDGANSPALFWEKLLQGFDAVTEITDRFQVNTVFSDNPADKGKMHVKYASLLNQDIKAFDNNHFENSAEEAVSMDPQQRLILEVSWEALENAGLDINALKGSKTGVFVGIDEIDYINREVFSGNPNEITPYSAVGVSSHAAAGRLSYFYDFKGPAVSVNSACSSSLVAMNLAIDSLRNGQCDLAIVAGVNLLLNPEPFIALSQFHALSPDGRCKTFDESADGFGRGEGCGVILLKKADDAKRDYNSIEALVRAVYVGQDGKSNGFFAPNGIGERRVMEAALKSSGLNADDIDYIEAHGTGTSLGDMIEAQAICEVYKNRKEPILVGSVKSNIGHLEAASGIAGVIKVLLSIKHGYLPASIHFHNPNPGIDWNRIKVVDQTAKWNVSGKKMRAGVNSFGITGTLVHVILESPETVADPIPSDKPEMPVSIITLSTKNKHALLNTVKEMKQFISYSNENICNIAYSTNVTRNKNEFRFAVVGETRDQLVKQMENVVSDETIRKFYYGKSVRRQRKVAFLFTGQGSVYKNAAKDFYNKSNTFRKVFDQCNLRFRELLNISIIDTLYQNDEDLLANALYSQPVIFSLEYSLTKLWDELDLVPDYVIGHSVGEYAALCYSGVLDFMDATNMIAVRSRLMDGVEPDGKMVGVLIEEEKVKQAIRESGCNHVSIAAVNAPENVTISGLKKEVDQVIALLQQKFRVFVNDLGILYPYHSTIMSKYAEKYGNSLDHIKCYKTPMKVISSVTGSLEDYQLFGDKFYWMKHLEKTVNFKTAVETASQLGVTIFIEIGGTATLSGLAGQCVTGEDSVFVPSIRSGVGNYRQLLESLKELYLNGIEVNWNRFYNDYQIKNISLPGYSFERKTFWKDRKQLQQQNDNNLSIELLLNRQNQQLQEQRRILEELLK